MKEKTGLFITFEGPEGAGKTTVLMDLSKKLNEAINVPLMLTREPGGITIAEKIREILLDNSHTMMDERTEALLYAAARRQHLVEKVIPALNKGELVLCDRFIDSSIAYQGVARGIGAQNIQKLNEFVIEGKYPDLTFYLDLSPEIGLSRIRKNRSEEMNRLDQESLIFHQKVRAGYLDLVKSQQHRIYQIDATQTVEEVSNECFNIIKTKYPWLFDVK